MHNCQRLYFIASVTAIYIYYISEKKLYFSVIQPSFGACEDDANHKGKKRVEFSVDVKENSPQEIRYS